LPFNPVITMNIDQILQENITKAFKEIFDTEVQEVALQPTNKGFKGSHTFVTFPYAKTIRKSPEEVAHQIGEFLQHKTEIIAEYNVAKGFLNLTLHDKIWIEALNQVRENDDFGKLPPKNQKVMVEYSSPNTNKPLHLGHLRNNFLGYSVSQILKASGYEVIKANLVNDRGIHICKSMIAYQIHGNGETPQSAGIKGDHLAGKYYVKFDKDLKAETKPILEQIEGGNLSLFHDKEIVIIQNTQQKVDKIKLQLEELNQKLQSKKEMVVPSFSEDIQASFDLWENKTLKTAEFVKEFEDFTKPTAEQKDFIAFVKKIASLETDISKEKDAIKQLAQNKTQVMKKAQAMLQQWEAGDTETLELWQKMNGWVYEGFHETYRKIGVSFDKMYYESNTYLLGKDIVEEGLSKGIFYKEADNSVWIDLTGDKMDKKLVLRGDGTSVYITQDLGTADLKYQDFQIDKSVYVVGNEQDYHFKVLFKILEKINRPYAQGMYHLSYGMVDLPSGKMKSREGTVVDADDLVDEMIQIAKTRTDDLGKTEGFHPEDLQKLYETIALGALKYFLLKVDPKKRMLFNPEESLDFQGDAGPSIQYNHARVCSILRTAQEKGVKYTAEDYAKYTMLMPTENQLLQLIYTFPKKVQEAGETYSPAIIAQYAYEVAKAYSSFFNECSIFKADTLEAMSFRVALTEMSGKVIRKAMDLLGIEVPERM
jgi:arginyl-tRNA synthetase